MKEIATKWYKQALHDLEFAEKCINIHGYEEYDENIANEKLQIAKKVFEQLKKKYKLEELK